MFFLKIHCFVVVITYIVLAIELYVGRQKKKFHQIWQIYELNNEEIAINN